MTAEYPFADELLVGELLDDWTGELFANVNVVENEAQLPDNEKPKVSRKRKQQSSSLTSKDAKTAKSASSGASEQKSSTGIYSSYLWQLAKRVEIVSKEVPVKGFELPVGEEKSKIEAIIGFLTKFETIHNAGDIVALKELLDEHCSDLCELRTHAIPQEGIPLRTADVVIPRDRILAFLHAAIESMPDAVLTLGQVRLRRTFPRSVGCVFLLAGSIIQSIFEDSLVSKFSDPALESETIIKPERKEVSKCKFAGTLILTLDADLKIGSWDNISIDISQS